MYYLIYKIIFFVPSRKIYDKNSNMECELIAYVLNNIVHNALHD